MKDTFDPFLVEPLDGCIHHPPPIMSVGDDPDPHGEDQLTPCPDMRLYQAGPTVFVVLAGWILPT